MNRKYTFICDKAGEINAKFSELEAKLEKCKERGETLFIDVIVAKNIFDDVFLPLLGRLDYYRSGTINSYKVIKEEMEILREDIYPNELFIDKPTIIFFAIDSDTVIHLKNEVVIMNEVKGTIIFENQEARLVARKLNNAKLIHPSGTFFPCDINDCTLGYKEDLCAIFS